MKKSSAKEIKYNLFTNYLQLVLKCHTNVLERVRRRKVLILKPAIVFVKQAFYFSTVLRFNIKPFQLLFLSLQFSALRRLRDEFLSGGPPDQTICSADQQAKHPLRKTTRPDYFSQTVRQTRQAPSSDWLPVSFNFPKP